MQDRSDKPHILKWGTRKKLKLPHTICHVSKEINRREENQLVCPEPLNFRITLLKINVGRNPIFFQTELNEVLYIKMHAHKKCQLIEFAFFLQECPWSLEK